MLHKKKFTAIISIFIFSAAFLAFPPVIARSSDLSKDDEKKYDLAFSDALAHFEKANILYKKSKLDETIKELTAVVGVEFPKGAEDRDGLKLQLDAYSFLGELLLEKKQPDKAVDILKEGLKKAPDMSKQTYQLYMTLGHVYKDMKKNDDALDAFDKAQKINKKLKEAEEARKASEK